MSESNTSGCTNIIVDSSPTDRSANYVVGSKSFRPDIQKPRQMENAVRAI